MMFLAWLQCEIVVHDTTPTNDHLALEGVSHDSLQAYHRPLGLTHGLHQWTQ